MAERRAYQARPLFRDDEGVSEDRLHPVDRMLEPDCQKKADGMPLAHYAAWLVNYASRWPEAAAVWYEESDCSSSSGDGGNVRLGLAIRDPESGLMVPKFDLSFKDRTREAMHRLLTMLGKVDIDIQDFLPGELLYPLAAEAVCGPDLIQEFDRWVDIMLPPSFHCDAEAKAIKEVEMFPEHEGEENKA